MMNGAMRGRIPLGYRFMAAYAGIRKETGDDLALMVSDAPASAAAVFTRNAVRAAPVTVSARHLQQSGGLARAIVANAGNANCAAPNMTAVAEHTAQAAAALAGVPREQILLASTGVIGEPLAEHLILGSLRGMWKGLSPERFEDCAEAIMTTDTKPKTAYAKAALGGGAARIAGMAKGAGMIMPDMATMLSFIFTDAAVEPDALQRMLKAAVERSFNCISVDSDTSTNDTVYLLANGASGLSAAADERDVFQQALDKVARKLALAVVRDGEGARKLVRIDVEGAAGDGEARKIAVSIANSPLVKTAIAGADPNWGRIIAAAGKSGVVFNPGAVDIFINETLVCEGGLRAEFDEEEVKTTMQFSESAIRFCIGAGGRGKAQFWTCDFNEEYIRINADYRT